MGKQTYDKPTRVLIREMASSLGLQPGQVLTTTRTLELFREHYPKLQANSIKAHLTQASTNDPNRLHHAVKPEDDFYYKIGMGQCRSYEPGKDPAPIHELVPGDVAVQERQTDDGEPEVGAEAAPAGSTEFLLKRDLQLYLARNLDRSSQG